MKHKASLWERKADEDDKRNMISYLCALVHREGRLTISSEELAVMSGGVGLRARYNEDGSVTLWTYDVADDLKHIAGVD